MNKLKVTFAALCCIALNAVAAPGYEVTSFAVSPMEGPNFAAAMEEWMNSDTAKKYKGRIYLQAHDNDGANPATHSVVAVYPSMTESEKFANWIRENPDALADWLKLIGKTSQISDVTSTMRFANVASFGEISDKDRVWVQHSLTSRDAPSLVRAMSALMNSETGKKFPGQLHVVAVVAGGLNAGSHAIVLGYESFAEMEAWGDTIGGSAAITSMLHTFSVINTYHGATISVDVNAWGKSLKSVLK
jgi:hypothetical protein